MDAELKSFIDLADKFTSKEIEPDLLERERYPFVELNDNVWKKAVETGLATITLPEEFGGSGQGMPALGAILQRISRTEAGTATMFLSQALAQATIAQLGSKAAAKKILDAEKMPIIAIPMFDLPDDLPDTVTATKDGKNFVLNGWAPYLVGAPVADVFLVPAKSGDDVDLFIVEKSMKGVTVGDPAVSLGLRTMPAADVCCEGVIVPSGNKLDAKKFPAIVDRFRAPAASIAVGLVAGCYETALDYCQERFQSKKHIIEHDQVRMMLTNMASIVDGGGPLCEHACKVADGSAGPAELLSIQTRLSNEAAYAATDGVQALGGYGYMHDYGQEKRMRDAKQLQSLFGPAAVKNLDVLALKLKS